MAASNPAQPQKAQTPGAQVPGAKPAAMTPVESKPQAAKPQGDGTAEYRLLSKHWTASGKLLKAGRKLRLTDAQAKGLVNKIEEVG